MSSSSLASGCGERGPVAPRRPERTFLLLQASSEQFPFFAGFRAEAGLESNNRGRAGYKQVFAAKLSIERKEKPRTRPSPEAKEEETSLDANCHRHLSP